MYIYRYIYTHTHIHIHIHRGPSQAEQVRREYSPAQGVFETFAVPRKLSVS